MAQKWLPNDYEQKLKLRWFPPPFSMTSWRSRAALLITHVDDTYLQYCVWVRWQDGKPSPRTDESQTKYRCTLYFPWQGWVSNTFRAKYFVLYRYFWVLVRYRYLTGVRGKNGEYRYNTVGDRQIQEGYLAPRYLGRYNTRSKY